MFTFIGKVSIFRVSLKMSIRNARSLYRFLCVYLSETVTDGTPKSRNLRSGYFACRAPKSDISGSGFLVKDSG